MSRFQIGKSTITIDHDSRTITFEHSDSILHRDRNSPWVVPAGAVEHIEHTRKAFMTPPSMRLILRDRAGYQPGIGADMNSVVGGRRDDEVVADLVGAVEQVMKGTEPVERGPVRTGPSGPAFVPAGGVGFGDLVVDEWAVTCQGEAVPLGKARAEVLDADAARSRVTATRVAAGAIIAGPVGALVGGMARKNVGQVFVMVTTDDGRVLSGEGPSKDAGKAAELVARVNAAAR